jgi:hypothetical protein
MQESDLLTYLIALLTIILKRRRVSIRKMESILQIVIVIRRKNNVKVMCNVKKYKRYYVYVCLLCQPQG